MMFPHREVFALGKHVFFVVLIPYILDKESGHVALEMDAVVFLRGASQMCVLKTPVSRNGGAPDEWIVCSPRDTDRNELIPNSSGLQIRYLITERSDCTQWTPPCEMFML